MKKKKENKERKTKEKRWACRAQNVSKIAPKI